MALLVSSLGGGQAMGWVLLLLLLLPSPPASLEAGNSARSTRQYPYGVIQPKHVSGYKGGSVNISFSFFHPWELAKDPQVRIFCRWQHFHGEYIYNSTPPFTHKHFQNRLTLNWTQDQTAGVLSILSLQKEDQTTYFLRVQVNTRKDGKQKWQSIEGTKLTISDAPMTTTKTATEATTAGLKVTEGKKSSESQPLSLEAMIGLALAIAVLIAVILGLIVFLRSKRKKGQQTKAQTPARDLSQNTEEKYENTGYKRQHTESKQDPKDDRVVYASLTLSNPTSSGASPCHPLHSSPQEETLYSVLKAK